MSANASYLPTPSPQPSPSRGEGVRLQVVADIDAAAEHTRLLDFEMAKESTNIPAYEILHRPLWERVGDRGC